MNRLKDFRTVTMRHDKWSYVFAGDGHRGRDPPMVSPE